jgi:hypothetical protein
MLMSVPVETVGVIKYASMNQVFIGVNVEKVTELQIEAQMLICA